MLARHGASLLAASFKAIASSLAVGAGTTGCVQNEDAAHGAPPASGVAAGPASGAFFGGNAVGANAAGMTIF